MKGIVCLLLLVCVYQAFAFFTNTIRPQTKLSPLSMTVKVVINEGEPIEDVLRRFKRGVNQAGILQELRYREHWETSAEKRKRKLTSARIAKRYERINDKYERRAMGVSEYNS